MSRRQKQTAFLKTLILHGDAEVRAQLEARIKQAERDEQCAWRALWLVSVLAVFSGFGICYSAVLIPEFFHNSWHTVVRLFCGLGLASLVCAVAFLACWLWCRAVLNRVQEDCRRFVMSMLEPGDRAQRSSGHEARNSVATGVAAKGDTEKSRGVLTAYKGYTQLFSIRRVS
jgi:hypothetical protein